MHRKRLKKQYFFKLCVQYVILIGRRNKGTTFFYQPLFFKLNLESIKQPMTLRCYRLTFAHVQILSGSLVFQSLMWGTIFGIHSNIHCFRPHSFIISCTLHYASYHANDIFIICYDVYARASSNLQNALLLFPRSIILIYFVI